MKISASLVIGVYMMISTTMYADEYGRTKEFQACLHKAHSNVDTDECTKKEFAKQDKRLNQQYKKALELFEPKAAKAFKETQRSWVDYVNKKCGFWNYYYEGGSLASRADAICRIEETTFRADEIESFANR